MRANSNLKMNAEEELPEKPIPFLVYDSDKRGAVDSFNHVP